MSANPTFVQALADATGRVVEVSPVVEATTVGAAFLAGLATGVWGGARRRRPRLVTRRASSSPAAHLDRAEWARAVERAAGWIPELSALDV